MKEILQPGTKKFRMTCSDCGAVFTYERSDVHQNYVHGGDWVSCPSCGRGNRHFGARRGMGYVGYGGSGFLGLTLVFLVSLLSACSADTFEASSGDAGGDAFGAGDVLTSDSSSQGDGGDAGSANADASDGFDGYTGPAFRRVFITSQQWTANLGGASGADAKCQAAANGASLGGTWMSWTSTSTSDPSLRFVHSTVPWKLLDGTLIADDWSDLTSGSLENPINRDENNNLVTFNNANYPTDPYSGIAWTDTSTSGHSSGYTNCSDFTDGTSASTSASVGYIGYYHPIPASCWTDAQGTAAYVCNSVVSLYCFEQ